MKNLLKWMPSNNSKKESPDFLYKKHIKEIAQLIKNDGLSEKYERKSSKVLKEPILSQQHIKGRIAEYLKQIARESSLKCEMKTFFVFVGREYLASLKSLIENFSLLEKSHTITAVDIVNYLKSIYEDVNYTTVRDLIEKINNEEEIEDSYLICLIDLIKNGKECEAIDLIQKDIDLTCLLSLTIDFIRILGKIQKISENDFVKAENTQKIIKKTLNYILPNITNMCIELLDNPEAKLMSSMIEIDQLRIFLNEVSSFKSLRMSLYTFLIKFSIQNKDNSKMNTLKKYIEENNCFESILTHITNSFLYTTIDLSNSIKREVLFICLTYLLYLDNSSSLFIDKVVQLLVLLIEKEITFNYDQLDNTLLLFFEQIILLDYTTKETIKSKLTEKQLDISEITKDSAKLYNSDIQQTEMASIMLGLFNYDFENDKEAKIKKIIMIPLLKDITLRNYKTVIHKTLFLKYFVENMYQCPEDIISRYFNILIGLYENQSNDNRNYPNNEINSIIKTLSKIDNEITLNIFLKHFQKLVDFRIDFQEIIASEGYLFIEMKNIIDCSINEEASKLRNTYVNRSHYTPFGLTENYSGKEQVYSQSVGRNSTVPLKKFAIDENEEGTKAIYSCEMISTLITLIESLIYNNKNNYTLLKQSGLLDSNYYIKFTAYPDMKIIAYKLWTIGIIHENERKEITKSITFINQRYNKIKEDLMLLDYTDHDDHQILQHHLNEINMMNEMIGLKLFKEKEVRNNKENRLIKIILDFPALLYSIRKKVDNGLSLKKTNEEENNANINNQPSKFSLGHDEISAIEIKNENDSMNNNSNFNNEIDKFCFWGQDKQKIIKIYINIIVDIFANYNKRAFTLKFRHIEMNKEKDMLKKCSIPFTKDNIKEILLTLFNAITFEGDTVFIHDLIKYIIDLSLRFKMNNNEDQKMIRISLRKKSFEINKDEIFNNEELFTDDFLRYYCDKYSIDNESLIQCDNSNSVYSNFSIKSPILLINILLVLHEKKVFKELIDYLKFILLITRVNENNTRLMLKQSFVSVLLDILQQCLKETTEHSQPIIINHINKIFKCIMKYMDQHDLSLLFQFIHYTIKVPSNLEMAKLKLNASNELLQLFHEAMKKSHKIKKRIMLSNINTKQPNIYNMIYATGLNLLNSKLIHLTNNQQEIKPKINCISIVISLKFHLFDNTEFILFKLDKEAKDKDTSIIEVSIDKQRLIVKENDIEIASSKGSILSYISNEKETNVIITLNKETNKIHVYFKYQHICSGNSDFKHLDLLGSSSYSILLGYPGSSTKDCYQDSFQILPHITLSYLMIYTDQLSTDFSEQFSLSKISSSKNGSIKADQLSIKYLNYRTYKTLVPSNFRKNPEYFDISLHIDPNKVIYELLADNIQLLSNNKLERMKTEMFFINSFMNKIHKKSYMDIMSKDFLLYIPNTNYYFKQNIYQSYVQHTFLLSKYQLTDSMLYNEIFHINTIKSQILTNVIKPNSSIDYEVLNFNMIESLLVILNDMHSFNSNHDKKLVTLNILKIISVYLVSDLSVVRSFCSGDDFKSLLIILSKSSEYFSNETIDLFFNLSFGLDENTSIQLLDPWYPEFITEILLDINLFQRMFNETKDYLITLLTTFFTPIVSYDPDYETKIVIIKKLYSILLSRKSTNEIETKIVKLITIMIDQMFKCKTGVNTPTDENLKEIINTSNEYLHITDCFSQSLSYHLEKRNFNIEELNETTKIVKSFFEKLYSEDVKEIRGIIYNYFHKLYNDFTTNPRMETMLSQVFKVNDNLEDSKINKSLTTVRKKISQKLMNLTSTNHEGDSSYTYHNSMMMQNKTIIKDNCYSDQKSIQSDCIFCSYLISRLKYEYNNIQSFNSYKQFIKKYYYRTNLFLQKGNQYLNSFGLAFSYNLYQREGPSRMRKKLIPKLNKTNNELLCKESHFKMVKFNKMNSNDNHDTTITTGTELNPINTIGSNCSVNPFDQLFSFYELNSKVNTITSLDQIFLLHFITQTLKTNDKYETSYNCLLFKGIQYYTCTLIIGEKNFYLLKNIHIDPNGILYQYNKPFSKIFWALNDYSAEWNSQCRYLNMKQPDSKEEDNKSKNSINHFKSKTFHFGDISELHKRRYLYQHNSIEFFFKNGKSLLLAFNKDKREHIYQSIIINLNSSLDTQIININSSLVNSNTSLYLRQSKLFVKKHKGKIRKNDKAIIDSKTILEEAQDKWANGLISNYDYIMILNTLAGRNYNDISQYPIFPWIIKDFCTDGLNLNNNDIYRNFTYPIYAQEKKTRETLVIKYESADQNDKYHSGTHYSTSGFVSYYLIRLKPFSQYATEIQGGYFDTADRIFANVKLIWDLTEKYQELIPEFYYLPELFVNYNEYQFGINLSKKNVNDVILPEWAKGDPRLFVKMIKKAMESCFVSEKINEWIDLIFGSKQQGKEAAEYLNVYREACYPFDPNMMILKHKKENETTTDMSVSSDKLLEELDSKMNEIVEMGQNPIQLFTKTHIKRERHQKSLAFFSKCAYLTNFKLKEKEYKVILSSLPQEIKGYFEIEEKNISQGEGGLSSFRSYCDYYNDEYSNMNSKSINSMNTFFIVGKDKVLIGPKYQNFIDYFFNKYSFSIVKPIDKMIMEYPLRTSSPIAMIKCTSDGKKIIVAFTNGNIHIYKLKKEYNEIIFHPDHHKKSRRESMSGLTTVSTQKLKMLDTFLFSKDTSKLYKDETSLKSSMPYHNHNPNPFNHANTRYDEIFSNTHQKKINTKPIIKPNISFMINDTIKDYFIHTTADFKTKKDISNGSKYYTLILQTTSTILHSQIKMIEICESFTMLIVIDVFNVIYLFDLTNLRLLRRIPLERLSMSSNNSNNNNKEVIDESDDDIKFITICRHTGDFALGTSYKVFLLSANGVLLAKIDIKEKINNSIEKITACTIKSLSNTESDIHLFTGHANGNLIVWKLETHFDKDEYIVVQNSFIDSYRYAYNDQYYEENHHKTKSQLRICFDRLIMIDCKNKPIQLIKLTEDLSTLIIINKDMGLFYLSYEEYLDIKKKAKQLKICPQCSNPVGKSNIYCQLCNKKLCSFCKLEQKIPEYSLKIKRPICEDCSKMTSSSNKMLYDF